MTQAYILCTGTKPKIENAAHRPSRTRIDMLFSFARALQLIGLAITLIVVILFFDSSYKMSFLMSAAITGIVTFYAGWFLQQ